jgi:hypothetical protein
MRNFIAIKLACFFLFIAEHMDIIFIITAKCHLTAVNEQTRIRPFPDGWQDYLAGTGDGLKKIVALPIPIEIATLQRSSRLD